MHLVCIPLFRSKVAYFKVLASGHLAKTSIAIISETVDRRAKQSSISTPRAISNRPKCHFRHFEMIFRLPADRPITYWRGSASVLRPSVHLSVHPSIAVSKKPLRISFYNFAGMLYGPISPDFFFLFSSDLFWPL